MSSGGISFLPFIIDEISVKKISKSKISFGIPPVPSSREAYCRVQKEKDGSNC